MVRQPDDRWGEVPVLFVVPGEPTPTEAEVRALLEGRIARYKMPKRIVFITESDLERNSTGKVQRQALEARLRQQAV
ncbi:MAG: hypothetical protein R3E48_16355 [Burkholderiaceae bacterium]